MKKHGSLRLRWPQTTFNYSSSSHRRFLCQSQISPASSATSMSSFILSPTSSITSPTSSLTSLSSSIVTPFELHLDSNKFSHDFTVLYLFRRLSPSSSLLVVADFSIQKKYPLVIFSDASPLKYSRNHNCFPNQLLSFLRFFLFFSGSVGYKGCITTNLFLLRI